MAGEIQMDVVLNPQMDKNAVQALYQTQDKLAARLAKAQRGSQLRLRAELAALAAMATKLGLSDTPRGYMMQFLSLTNQGQYSSFQKALARGAGQQGAAILKSEKRAAQQLTQQQRAEERVAQQATIAAQKAEEKVRRDEDAQRKEQARAEAAHRKELLASAKQTEVERAYDTKQFVEARYRREEIAGIRRGYKGARAEHMRLLREGGTQEEWDRLQATTVKLDSRMTRMISNMEKNGKQAAGYQKKTAADTHRLATEVAAGGKVISSPLSGLGQLGALGLRALGLGSLVGAVVKAVNWAWRQGQAAINRGATAYDRQAQYGYDEGTLASARLTQREYSTAPGAVERAQDYGADFRERMMWGEVSDREWIALSRMGEYGRLLMSGAGETDPERVQRALESHIRAAGNNPRKLAQLRHDLTVLGQDASLANIRMRELSPQEYENLYQQYKALSGREVADARIHASIERGIEPLKEQFGARVGGFWGQFIGGKGASKIVEEMRQAGYADEEIRKFAPQVFYTAQTGSWWKGQRLADRYESQRLAESQNLPHWLKPDPELGQVPRVGSQVFYINQTINTSDPTRAAEESAAFIQKDAAELTQAASRFNRNIGRAN